MSTTEVPNQSLANVRDIVAVHSAKGGVGKSTTASNLAVAFSRMGLSVGLLDADIHGPSIAHMFGSSAPPEASLRGQLVLPLERHGVRYLSLANVAADDAPIIWRGPMVSGALQQLLTLIDWGELDLLLIDMPPGTGDVVLSLGQSVPLSGVVTVTTPQEVSLSDTRRGIRGFEQLQVPILGVIENMAGFVCDECGEAVDLFGREGGERTARDMELSFLGRIPLEAEVVTAGDAGTPLMAREPDGRIGRAFDSVAHSVLTQLAMHGRARTGAFDVAWAHMAPGEIRREPPETPDPAGRVPEDSPVAVWQASDDALGILWGDGETTFYGAYPLRMACHCAECVEEWSREKMPSLDDVPKNVRPVTIETVGRYALQPTWSDGHKTGIYSFRELRRGLGSVEL